ncbi:MAG: hypothetical protein ACP5G0_01990 [Desulfomonilia bacterium]
MRIRRTVCHFIALVLVSTIIGGCDRNHVMIIQQNTLGNQSLPIGRTFSHYPFFFNATWDSVGDRNRPVVIFETELPLDQVLHEAARDQRSWLSVERRYFTYVSSFPRKATLRITFDFDTKEEFHLGTIQVGLASQDRTVWTSPVDPETVKLIIDSIFAGTDECIKLASSLLDPSMPGGSALYADLTGVRIDQFWSHTSL